MRDLVSSRWSRWTVQAGLLAFLALAWAVIIPEGYLWTGLAAAGFTFAAAVFLGGRSVLSIDQTTPVDVARPRGVVFPDRVAARRNDAEQGAQEEWLP